MFLLKIGGYICIAAGIVLAVLAYMIPEARVGLIIGTASLLAAGVIDLMVFRFFMPIMESLPKPEGAEDADMGTLKGTVQMNRALWHQGAAKMESATATLREMNRANHLREHGLRGRARVLAIRDTGQLINFDPILEFDLEVTTDGGEPYYVQGYRQVVSKIVYPRIEVGRDYAAFVDPEDQNSVFVSWQ